MMESFIFINVNYNINIGYKASFCFILTGDYRHFLSVSSAVNNSNYHLGSRMAGSRNC